MSRFARLFVLALVLGGCGAASDNPVPVPLAGTLWQVEDIDSGGIIDRSYITLEFPSDEQVGGTAGCNRYFGGLALDAGQFSVSGAGSTRRACVPAIMEQEQRFLAALAEAQTYAVADDLWLELYDAKGARRIRAIRIEEEPAMDDAAADEPDDAL